MKGKESLDDVNDSKLEGIVKVLDILDRRIFLCAKHTGSWMTIWVTTVTGIVLSAMGFRGFFMHITMLPP